MFIQSYSLTVSILLLLFFFNDTAPTEIYTLSLHDALPIWPLPGGARRPPPGRGGGPLPGRVPRSEEHTSELQSRPHLVCRLLLEKKKRPKPRTTTRTRSARNSQTVAAFTTSAASGLPSWHA